MRDVPGRRAAMLLGSTAAVVAVGLASVGAHRAAAALFPVLLPARPWFVPEHGVLLYLALPVAAVATVALLLAPGVLLALALGRAQRLGELAAESFAGALLLRGAAHALLKSIGLVPVGFAAFAAAEIVMLGVLALAVVRRMRSGRPVAPWFDAADGRRLLWMVGIIAMALLCLLPSLYWQDLTDDGMEALEIGRSLAWHVVPRFPSVESGLMGLGIGMLTMAYPVGWFVALIGPVEAAARLPLLLYLPVLFVVLVDLIEERAPRRLGPGSEGAILLALSTFVVAMVFSASYTPYSADASAPAAFETFTVLGMASTVLFAWRGRTGWMLVSAVLTYLGRPTGLMVPGLLALGAFALPREERMVQWRRMAAALAACIAVGLLYERLFMPAAAGGLPSGYASGSIADRFRYLVLTDVRRVLYVALPGGLLPAVALLAWKRQDRLARQLTVFVVLYFLFFHVQAFVALHHFVPAMILPLVVAWRITLFHKVRWAVPAAVTAGMAALVLSLPASTAIARSTRAIGYQTEVRVGDLNGDWAAYRQALSARSGMMALFPVEWEVTDPSRERVGEPLGFIYYAARRPRVGAESLNYLVQAADAPDPAGFTRIAGDGAFAVFVRDLAQWMRDRQAPPSMDYRAPAYAIPRTTLHSFLGIPAHAYQVDLASLPGLWRFFE